MADGVMYKDIEVAHKCFYVDLLPGDHEIAIRAHGDRGFGARVRISERGALGPWWYNTFDFACGAADFCDKGRLRKWQADIQKLGGKIDPCGSTKISHIHWQSGQAPDDMHLSDLLLTLAMQVYDFVPQHGPADEACARK